MKEDTDTLSLVLSHELTTRLFLLGFGEVWYALWHFRHQGPREEGPRVHQKILEKITRKVL